MLALCMGPWALSPHYAKPQARNRILGEFKKNKNKTSPNQPTNQTKQPQVSALYLKQTLTLTEYRTQAHLKLIRSQVLVPPYQLQCDSLVTSVDGFLMS